MRTPFARRNKTALPEMPEPLERHPDWLAYQSQRSQFERAVNEARRSIAAIENDRQQILAEISEARVAAALGEQPNAAARVTTAKERLAAVDERLAEAREHLETQVEASRRIASRESSIRASVAAQIRESVRRVNRELREQLAQALAPVLPINEELLRLRARHAADVPELASAVYFDELSPRISSSGLPSKMRVFLDSMSGVEVEI